MSDRLQFYIDGGWVDPTEPRSFDVVNPTTEEPIAKIALGGPKDVDRAVSAARRAFADFAGTAPERRVELLRSIADAYQKRYDELAETISKEVGAPLGLSKAAQAATGLGHLNEMLRVLPAYSFEQEIGKSRVLREPIGVCGFITPWNWPLNQILCKVAPALAAGCTMVLKPSEVAPLNALLLAEILDEAGVPAGVFNLVNGDGPTVGAAIASHPDVDLVSFTGSTRAGVEMAKAAADSVRRVTQELGGKGPNLLLDDVDLEAAVAGGVQGCFMNSGQSCNAPTRMLVPRDRHDEAAEIARRAAESAKVGDPFEKGVRLGPLVSEAQWKKVQRLVQQGIDEGATLVTGGTGRPEGLERGYFARPTVFAGVRNDMTIAREEIFGPVLSILPYRDEEEAVRIANDTPYGLSSYVSSADPERAFRVARRLRAGAVHINGASPDFAAPFGGYKQSGNGREWGRFGLEEFLEVKSVMGAASIG